MTFMDAIRTCLQKYATFSGRARRPEYWWFALFIWIGTLVTGLLDSMIFGPDMGLLGMIWGLGLILPAIAVGVRRLHDIGRSGWWMLIGLIPIIGTLLLIYWFVQPSVPGNNAFGPEPTA
jgi:uncharacterized membrane protein YhaH (DUF805 family)